MACTKNTLALDTMDKWDQEKLQSVVLSKHGNPKTTTDVSVIQPPISRDLTFLADCMQVLYRSNRDSKVRARNFSIGSCFTYVGQRRFGWFWECPNGGEKCMYRHALPTGFVLKADRKAAEDAAKANVISLEEFLEVEVRAINICLIYILTFRVPAP
jgi:hypothetical protein